MSILSDIQQSITSDQNNIAPVLLKLRLLAAKLNNKELENWIKFESEGYPDNIEPPDYRKISVSYLGNFLGPAGAQMTNISIPSILIGKIAGEQWIEDRLRYSISSIESLISNSKDIVYTDASNLIPLLHNKLYERHICLSVTGRFSSSALVNIQNSVRHRILEFTIQLEKSIPSISSITFPQKNEKNNLNQNKQITQIFNQTIYGDTSINTGDNMQISLIIKGDKSSLIKYFYSNKIPEDDAKILTDIIASEQPKNKENPLGTKIKKWIKENLIKKSELWKIASSTLLKILEKAISSYHGL